MKDLFGIKQLFTKPTKCSRCGKKTLQTNSVCLTCFRKDIEHSKTIKESIHKLLYGIGKQPNLREVKE